MNRILALLTNNGFDRKLATRNKEDIACVLLCLPLRLSFCLLLCPSVRYSVHSSVSRSVFLSVYACVDVFRV